MAAAAPAASTPGAAAPSQVPSSILTESEAPKPPPVKTVQKSKRWLRAQLGREGLTPRRRRAQTAGKVAFGSHSYYNNMWADTMHDVRQILATEKKGAIVTGDRKQMFPIIFGAYMKYLKVFKALDEEYDQMVHPQKRLVVRKLLDLMIGRLLELKTQLVMCDLSEVYYLDDIAAVEGLLPKDFDMPIPKYYYHDPTQEMMDRDQWFENVRIRDEAKKQEREDEERRKKQKEREELQEQGWDTRDLDDEKIDFEDTIIPVQSMERCRQAKGKFIIMKFYQEEESNVQKKRQKHAAAVASKRRMDPERAAIVIQKVARGFIARAKVKKMRNDEMEFLGIRGTAKNFSTEFSFDYFYNFKNDKCQQNAESLEALKESRRVLRKIMHKQYEQDKITIYERMQAIEGPDIAERFKYQIRTWYLDWKEKKGKFPTIPKADVGGSMMMICPENLPEEVREKGKEATDPVYAEKKKKEREKEKERRKREKAKAKAKDKGKKGKKNKNAGLTPQVPKLEPALGLEDMKEANFEYNKFWRGLDDKDNPEQKHEMKIIVREKRQIVADEVRVKVDIAMREELAFLKKELEKKKGKGGKGKGGKGKGKKGKGKGKKGKKGKGKGKKGKKKRGKDLTKNRTMESLFEELVHNNIIKQYPKVRLSSLLAQTSFINGELREYHTAHPFPNKTEERYMPGNANPPASYGDILKAVKNTCILPMGSVEVHQMATPMTKSVLIAGPRGSGKRLIVNTICTELNATLMDLTPANIAGKYPGKPGLKMLMHLIDKVGQAVAPVVIFIDDCEKMFQKKVPKTDKTDPKRLKKALPKFVKKNITGEDLFLVVGCTSEPWLAGAKLKKLFQRTLYIPTADYAMRYEMWKKMLSENADILSADMNYSLLAKLTQGWSVGNIKRAIDDVVRKHHKEAAKQKRDRDADMNPWGHLGNLVVRKMLIGKLNITMDKLIDCIAEYDPVFIEQEKVWLKWWNKTPMQKARISEITKAAPGKGKKGGKDDKKGKGKRKY